MEIKHHNHEHPLTLCENNEAELFSYGYGRPFFGQFCGCSLCQLFPRRCFACNKDPSGSFYICKNCNDQSPLIHKFCAELPKVIEISFHPHGSLYCVESFSDNHWPITCDFCNKLWRGYIFRCNKCSFKIDFGCAAWLIKFHEGKEHINHFSHRHLLTLLDLDHNVNCKVCNKTIHDQFYGCAPCEFYVHNSCRELHREIQHPFHPLHPLTLQQTKLYKKYICNACGFSVEGFTYRCDKCEFDLHPECESLKPSIKYKGHEHHLTLIENFSCQSQCLACGFELIGAFFVRCVECDINFHVQCGVDSLLPVNVCKHHEHPLTLAENIVKDDSDHQFFCNVCNKERNADHPFYCCVECEFSAHVRCVVTEVQFDEREKQRHFSHKHLLILQERERNDHNSFCNACEKDIHGPSYGCDPCKFYLHKSCVELPRKIQHSFHPHPLVLPEPYTAENRKCNACHKHYYGFSYCCYDCNFNLDVDCALLQPSIKFEGHEHILTFFEKLYHVPKCIACDFASPDASYLRCVKCNFNIHLLCSPLPQNVKHRSHQHSLTLTDSFVEDDSGEYYCDACENERDSKECVYYCVEPGCFYVAEFNCVISEVILSLKGELGDVPLRTVNREIIDKEVGKGLTLKDILELDCQIEGKQNKMEGMANQIDKELNEICKSLSKSGNFGNVSISENSPYSDEDFFELMVWLNPSKQKKVALIKFWDIESEIVNVNDYIITQNLAPVFRDLLAKYGDIGANCHLSQGPKTAFLVILCGVVQSMSNTKVMDITDNLISSWWFWFKVVHNAGFEIPLAFNQLKKIAHARFGTNTEIYRSNPLYKFHIEKVQLSQEIDKLTQEIDKLRVRIEELEKQTQDIISTHHSERSRLEVNNLSEALELRMKIAATGFL